MSKNVISPSVVYRSSSESIDISEDVFNYIFELLLEE